MERLAACGLQVLSLKKLRLDVEPRRVYASILDELRFKAEGELPAEVTNKEAWAIPEVRAVIEPRVKTLLRSVCFGMYLCSFVLYFLSRTELPDP